MALATSTRQAIREEVHAAVEPLAKDIQENKNDLDNQEKIINGDNGDGIKGHIIGLQKDMEYVKDFIKDWKDNVNKAVLAIVLLILTQFAQIIIELLKNKP